MSKMADAFQGFLLAVAVAALLLSSVALIRLDTNSVELSLMRQNIKNLEIQILKAEDSPCKPCGKYIEVFFN